jgi:hypothetical protein
VRDKEADEELASFLAAPGGKYLKRVLWLLTMENDPRNPKHSELNTAETNVVRIKDQAPTWFRLKVGIINIRIVFRLLQDRGSKLTEYQVEESIWDDCDNLIDVRQVGHRTSTFYAETRRRWRRTRGQ